jgi:type VI secretion system secreted protein VgrG
MTNKIPSRAARVVLTVALAATFRSPPSALASSILGSGENLAIPGGSAVTNTAPTTIGGNTGRYSGSSITGGSIALTGTVDQAAAPGMTPTQGLTGIDLGGLTLDSGAYSFASSAQLSGILTLDAETDLNALFVFQIGSTLTTAGASLVYAINSAADSGIFWEVGSSAMLGTDSTSTGNIIPDQSIALTASAANLCGRALALNGEVTLAAVSAFCVNGADVTSVSSDGALLSPEPGTASLVCAGLLAAAFRAWRARQAAA